MEQEKRMKDIFITFLWNKNWSSTKKKWKPFARNITLCIFKNLAIYPVPLFDSLHISIGVLISVSVNNNWEISRKNEPSEIWGRQPLKKFTWSILEYLVPIVNEFILHTVLEQNFAFDEGYSFLILKNDSSLH